ncbi:hypothetical protein Ancab_000227 [Ancistrocladus abbreviatus]
MNNKFPHHSSTSSNGKDILNNDGNPNSSMEETKWPICKICNKEFPSNKSLFGHIKCHQKTDWRGIQPPPIGGAARNSYCQTILDALCRRYPVGFEMEAADCPGTNLFRSLPLGWLTAGRRGQKNEDVIMSSSLNDPLLLEGAYNLMLLSQGGSQNLKTKHKIKDYRPTEGKRNRKRGNRGVGNLILQRNSALEELKFTNNDTEDSS